MSPITSLPDQRPRGDDNRSEDDSKCDDETLKGTCASQLIQIKTLNISELNLSGCQLTEIPDISGDMSGVMLLNLSNNKLTQLPLSFSLLNKVRVLDLSCNMFEEPPKCLFQGMCLIKELNLSKNKLKQFNLAPLCAALLKVLKLNNNLMASLPAWLFHDISACLSYLDISVNPGITINSEFPSTEGTDKICDCIQTMNLSNCGLDETSVSFITHFSHLNSLDLSNYVPENNFPIRQRFKFRNVFQTIPVNSLQLLVNLSELKIRNVGLPAFEDDISNLPNLKVLDISHNPINWLPKGVCEMSVLEKFVASSCELYFLPCNIGNLKSLKELYLDDNQLSSLPGTFDELENLEVLDLYKNSFTTAPDIAKFKHLKAVDVSMNSFDLSSEIMVDQRIKPYEELRSNLLSHIQGSENRVNERKEVASDEVTSESDDCDTSDLDSNSWTRSYSNCGNEYIDDDDDDDDDYHDYEEEVWDCYSNDSDDYFDPNDDHSHFSLVKEGMFALPPGIRENKNYFCPHKATLQFWGTQTQGFGVVEGQFEDP